MKNGQAQGLAVSTLFFRSLKKHTRFVLLALMFTYEPIDKINECGLILRFR
ncbi:hypothetical protein HMPREF9373_2211 [Psychrobacter sp. 1501(2011)]|nr:hypothetical protein HMPREF9373_2211 [Psychrobacter sp. 1501(2011)]